MKYVRTYFIDRYIYWYSVFHIFEHIVAVEVSNTFIKLGPMAYVQP
jgi:hypothetical protein